MGVALKEFVEKFKAVEKWAEKNRIEQEVANLNRQLAELNSNRKTSLQDYDDYDRGIVAPFLLDD